MLTRHSPSIAAQALASILGGRPHYIHFGWFLISVANLIVIVLMVAVFVLAIVVPFPGVRKKKKKEEGGE